jgi:hypothetical protein
MIVQHMQKKEKMLKIAEAAIENKTKMEPNFTSKESLIKQWLAEVFDYAYGLGEASGLMIAQNMIKSTDTQINNILKKDPQ